MRYTGLATGFIAAAVSIISAESIFQPESTFQPARPPAIPLAVKSPYLSTWQSAGSNGGNGGYLAGQWPIFYTGDIIGWSGMIRVDGRTYTWMGAPDDSLPLVDQTSFEYTSTRSVFSMDVGGLVTMTITFLSPLFPNDFKRQSLIFSYMNVEVSSADGGEHDVSIYTDVSAEWAASDDNTVVEWAYDTADLVNYHRFNRQNQLLFSETRDQADWGNWYYATSSNYEVTHQSGANDTVRNRFIDEGTLDNSEDSDFRAISDHWPVFGFAVDLGSVSTNPTSSLFVIGLAQDEAIQFDSADGVVSLPSLWKSYFNDGVEALQFFFEDYGTASQEASDFDNRVDSDSTAAGGTDYLAITSLSVRQAFGTIQFVGTESKTYVFMKEISSNGNVNTVDVIFPFHPVLVYTNPTFLKLLLDPLYENQEAGKYPNDHSMHDLGKHYPNATGHEDGEDEKQPLEECGNMLIMTLAYAQSANDVQYLRDHYEKLLQWNQYLIYEALIPADQISSDDFAGSLPNQTNLAMKGMVGIRAMSEIARLTDHPDDAQNFSDIAVDYINQWTTLGVAKEDDPPHSTLSYGDDDSHGLLYNLWADRELGFDFVPQEVYEMQSTFYPSVANEFGVPLDTRHDYTKLDWEVFVASIASNETRAVLYQKIVNWINTTPTSRPLTDIYETMTGDFGDGIMFTARPSIGGVFAQLALSTLENARQQNGLSNSQNTTANKARI